MKRSNIGHLPVFPHESCLPIVYTSGISCSICSAFYYVCLEDLPHFVFTISLKLCFLFFLFLIHANVAFIYVSQFLFPSKCRCCFISFYLKLFTLTGLISLILNLYSRFLCKVDWLQVTVNHASILDFSCFSALLLRRIISLESLMRSK